jgi:hypothetical protein
VLADSCRLSHLLGACCLGWIEQVTRLQHNGEARNVRIVLQCRVRTSAIKKTSKKAYWVLNNPADIRPCESHRHRHHRRRRRFVTLRSCMPSASLGYLPVSFLEAS